MMTQNNGNRDRDTAFRTRINWFIKAPEVRVIGADGTMLGVMTTAAAIALAQEQSLDLVEINPKSTPPVCRIVNHGKWAYEENKKLKAEKKKQKQLEQKQIELRPNTQENDLEHKLAAAKEFLSEGRRVRFVVKFKGREMSFKDLGLTQLNFMLEQLTDLISGSTPISMEGRDMSTIVSPKSTNKQ